MKKALVTGGAGFLGLYIVEQLISRGYQVSVLYRGDYPHLAQLPVTIFKGSVTDHQLVAQAVKGQDLVFHTAAKVGYWGDYQDYYHTNVVGTKNIIACCQQADVKKLIYTSSPSVTMNNIDIHNGDESLPYPDYYHTHYSATKSLAEQLLLKSHNPNGLQTLAIRPHLILGPRDNHLLPRLLNRAQSGKLKQIGPGTNRVSVTYVENAAHAHILAAESNNTGGKSYFINEPEPVLLWNWIKEVLRTLGTQPPRIGVPFFLAYGAGWCLEWVHRVFGLQGEPMVTRFIASELYRNHYFSIRRAQQDFNYEPLFSLHEAQARTIASLQQPT
ncbi:MAG: NAD-dependent epimerase/dehydratase family protein [Ketobacter sp.]|nr:MAG: NAD-dependent epimerase/dehydratase family protein [Ketobacter sp.]